MLFDDVLDRAAVQPEVVGEVRSDQAAEIGAVAREADVVGPFEDRPSLLEARRIRQAASATAVVAACRTAAADARRGASSSAWYSAIMPGVADQRPRQQVVVHQVQGGENDREVEAVEPPPRQRVVEFADAVGFVIEQSVAIVIVVRSLGSWRQILSRRVIRGCDRAAARRSAGPRVAIHPRDARRARR